ncbi:NUDIX hydrolase [Winogradskyella eckloniae]|uniref:NUDIX hydrolase n=1 Tax=Winogradskyella eckloniae TaxID=1089306 RepID=UPI00156798C7|nr:NUDIX domain-containing protein [Winogradskyella eckloniae]NRD19275.1 NUDIX hydrolase [Winogradskyella eckloniae]
MALQQDIKVAVDAVIFGYESKGNLSVLLIKRGIEPFKDAWAMPGGLVLERESLEAAVKRELKEETGVRIDYLEQLYTFGKPNRDPRNRVISVSYFGLVRPNHFKIKGDTDAVDAKWFPVNDLPKLAFDHKKIFQMAAQRLKGKLMYQPIGFDLLSPEFPFSDLEHLYTTILGRDIDRRNFRKKIKSFGFVEETDKLHQEGSGRPAKLFKFNKQKYDTLVDDGFHFDIKFV